MKTEKTVYCCDECKKLISDRDEGWDNSASRCEEERQPYPSAGKCNICKKLLCSDCLIVASEGTHGNEVPDRMMGGTWTQCWHDWSFWCKKHWSVERDKRDKAGELIRRNKRLEKEEQENKRKDKIEQLKKKINLSDDELRLLKELLR